MTTLFNQLSLIDADRKLEDDFSFIEREINALRAENKKQKYTDQDIENII